MTAGQGSRKLILQMGISVDGFVAVPGNGGLTPVMDPTEDPELTRAKLDWLSETGAHLMGRVTYARFAQSLARLGLIDTYRLVTHPVAVARGEPLFKDLSGPARLRLVETRTFPSAAVQVYEPAP
jgi:dihydrofolate reductase